MSRCNWFLDTVLVLAVAYYLVIAPYTKVEESFTIQAAHDVVAFGIYPELVVQQNYDHIGFPGVVPRTFVGSVILGYICKGIVTGLAVLGIDVTTWSDSQIVYQYIVRAVLGLANVWGLLSIRDAINSVTFRDKPKRTTHKKGVVGIFYVLVLVSQFHVLYYASRTLPNFVALPLVNYSISKLLRGDISGFTWLGLTAVIFRLEVGVLAVIIAVVSSLGFGQSNIFINLLLIAIGSVAGTVISGLVDSYFWGYWVVPEFAAVYFNVFQGKSAEWGVEPFWTYFTVHLKKLFRIELYFVLLIQGLFTDPADDGSSHLTGGTKPDDKNTPVVPHPARHGLRIMFVSSVLYMAAMSFQPHKEWRFIIYVIPIFSLQAANGAYRLSQQWSKSFAYKLWILITVAALLVGTLVSFFMGYVSSFNYPGGEAVDYVNQYVLHEKSLNHTNLTVHFDVATCMSGFTRFTELQQNNEQFVIYDKTEEPEELKQKWNEFDIVVLATPSFLAGLEDWESLTAITKYLSFNILPLVYIVQEEARDKMYIPKLAMLILDEAIEGKFDQIKRLLDSLILKPNYLYVFKRIGHKGTMIPEAVEEIANDFVEPSDIEDVSFEDIKHDINVEIDAVEEMHQQVSSEESK